MESGTLDGAMVKATFFSLCFGGENPHLSAGEARAFADCFVRYETRTRTVASGSDPNTGEDGIHRGNIYRGDCPGPAHRL